MKTKGSPPIGGDIVQAKLRHAFSDLVWKRIRGDCASDVSVSHCAKGAGGPREGGRERGRGGRDHWRSFLSPPPRREGRAVAGSATIQVFDVREFVRNASFQCRNGVGWAHPDRAAVRLRLISLIASF